MSLVYKEPQKYEHMKIKTQLLEIFFTRVFYFFGFSQKIIIIKQNKEKCIIDTNVCQKNNCRELNDYYFKCVNLCMLSEKEKLV